MAGAMSNVSGVTTQMVGTLLQIYKVLMALPLHVDGESYFRPL